MRQKDSWVDIIGVLSLAVLTLVVAGLFVLLLLSSTPTVRCV